MGVRAKKHRKRMLRQEPNQSCFYCGIGFDPSMFRNAPKKGKPGHKKFRHRTLITIEHLEALSRGGKYKDNCVLAHCYCNTVADSRPIEEKHSLVGVIRDLPHWQERMGIYL